MEELTLKEYLKNHFTTDVTPSDDSFLDFWYGFMDYAKEFGAAKAINDKVCPSRPVNFEHPDKVTAEMYESAAGKIPVIRTHDVNDFENLITNAICKGVRPANISSTGASFVCGKTTRFIILSDKPYSNVSAATMGLEEADWREKSMAIRLEHECTHYFTKKYCGTAQNHLHDELMADFFGLMNAFGFYKAEYFLYFMGVKGTEGTRLKCYVPECSEDFFNELKQAAEKLSRFFEEKSNDSAFKVLSKPEQIKYFCSLKLDELI